MAAPHPVAVSGKNKLDGTPLTAVGIPAEIPMGWVNRAGIQPEVYADTKAYSFCGAMVEQSPCVFIGEYEGTVYYSTDGHAAAALGSKQIDLMYWEHFTVTLCNPTNSRGDGVVTAQDARVTPDGKLSYTEKTLSESGEAAVRVYAGEKLEWSAKPGQNTQGVRYVLKEILIDGDASKPILPAENERYGASYSWDVHQDTRIDVHFAEREAYQIRFEDTTFLYADPSPDGQAFYAGETAVQLCSFHADQGFYTVGDQRIVAMSFNGHALNMPDDTKLGLLHDEETAITQADGYTVTVTVCRVSSLSSMDVQYKYKVMVQNDAGIYEDLVFAPVFEQMQKSELELCLYVDGQRRGDGLEVYLWNGADAVRQHDASRYEMKSSLTTQREVKLFFFNVKPGYMLDGNPSAENAHNNDYEFYFDNDYEFYFETPDQIPDTWRMTLVSLHKWADLNPAAARQAAKNAGYRYAVRIAGDDTTDGRDQYKIRIKAKACDMYVTYADASGDANVTGMPQGYFGAYEVDRDAHLMQSAPVRPGYVFEGWKLRRADGVDQGVLQPGDTYQITGGNFQDAVEQTVDTLGDCWVYTFEPVWKKMESMYRVEHYLPDDQGGYSAVPTLSETCLTPAGDTTVFIVPMDAARDQRFEHHVPDYDYSKAHGLVSSPTSDTAPFTGVLKLYYKDSREAYVDYTWKEVLGASAYEDWFDRKSYDYIWPEKNPDGPYAMGASVTMPEPPPPSIPGSTFMGWRLSRDPSGTLYKPGEAFVLTRENWKYTIHHEYMQGTGIIIPDQDKYEFYPVWKMPTANLSISKTVTGYAGDTSKAFEFLLSAIGPDGASLRGQTFKVSGVEGMQELTFGQWNAPFKLKHGDTLVIAERADVQGIGR